MRSWNVAGAKGRPRTYYELTAKGIAAAAAEREALEGLIGRERRAPSAETIALMSERLRRCVSVSAFVLKLQRGVREATRRQGR